MSEEARQVSLKLEWRIPEGLAGRYATNMVVQRTEHEFILSFFEAYPPMVIGSPDEIKAQLEQLETVRAECIARIIVAASRMPEFVEVLQKNLQHSLSQREQELGE